LIDGVRYGTVRLDEMRVAMNAVGNRLREAKVDSEVDRASSEA
jgi:hypothetical protein